MMKRLVLAGAGHAHLNVLKSLVRKRWPGVEVILISPHDRQIYSGMVPGWMAGHYRLAQCAADLLPLAHAAGVRFIQDSVLGLDAGKREIVTARSGTLAYDVLSLDTGAAIDTDSLAATDARFLPIRPLEAFVAAWTGALAAAKAKGRAHLLVVGGGAAGVELALAARYRLAQEIGAANAIVSLISGSDLLPGHGKGIVRFVTKSLARQGVVVYAGRAVGCPEGVQLADGRIIAADSVIAATGVKPAEWLAASGLALATDGFIAVGDGQQSVSHAAVFAAGDVATRVDAPHAKSGVYAVRAGPVLAANLQRAIHGEAPLSYVPQKRSLYLLATGPREAILSWGPLSARGRWVWKWKDWIDQRFMRQYDLGPETCPGES